MEIDAFDVVGVGALAGCVLAVFLFGQKRMAFELFSIALLFFLIVYMLLYFGTR